MTDESNQPTLGSLFAGIGGFDLGFERGGWKTKWQVEINEINRAVLADRFPAAERFEDVTQVGSKNLARVDCITAGFPCQDISNGGNSRKDKSHRGLKGERSGLFFEVIRILRELQPAWVVLENVPQLLSSNGGEDFETVLRQLADCGYLGFWRVLDAQYFGVPQRRRRIFLVAGFGRYPSFDLLSDSAPVEGIPSSSFPQRQSRPEVSFAGHTLSAKNTRSRINLGYEVLVAEEDGWSQMVERERSSEIHGLPCGLDEWNWALNHGAGNAVCPAIAEWIAQKIKQNFEP